MKIKVKSDYAKLRKSEYPDIGDQVDVLWKIVDELVAAGTIKDKTATDMLDVIKSVKTKYVKPSE